MFDYRYILYLFFIIPIITLGLICSLEYVFFSFSCACWHLLFLLLHMTTPTVLKRRHDLKSVNSICLTLHKKFKDINIPSRSELGRVKSLVRTEDLSDDECKRHFTIITLLRESTFFRLEKIRFNLFINLLIYTLRPSSHN